MLTGGVAAAQPPANFCHGFAVAYGRAPVLVGIFSGQRSVQASTIPAMKPPRVRLKFLLWTLLGSNLAMTSFMLFMTYYIANGASEIERRESVAQKHATKRKTEIQSMEDTQKLRWLALKSQDNGVAEWRERREICRMLINDTRWFAIFMGTMAMLSVGALYCLRKQGREGENKTASS